MAAGHLKLGRVAEDDCHEVPPRFARFYAMERFMKTRWLTAVLIALKIVVSVIGGLVWRALQL
jgi:hypothetical protein